MPDSHNSLKSKKRYVYIRLASSEMKQFDISVYLENGERLKVNREDWKEGRVFRGASVEIVDSINHRIDTLINKIVQFIKNGGEPDARSIEYTIYGSDFLAKHKKKRTLNRSIPIIEIQPSAYLKELWKEYPKQKFKQVTNTTKIDEEGFEVWEKAEIEIIKDQISLDDFPHKLPLPVLKKLIKEFEKESGIPFKKDDTGLMRTFLLYFIREKLYDKVINEVIDVDKETISQTDIKGHINSETGELDWDSLDTELLATKKNNEQKKRIQLINALSIEKRFEEGFRYANGKYQIETDYFDPNNIIHLFGLCRFGKKYNEGSDKFENITDYPRLWKSVLDFWINCNPSTDVKDFNIKWINAFLKYLVSNGHIKNNFKLNNNLFHLNKEEYINRERAPFALGSFTNICKWTNDYIRQLYQLELIPKDFSSQIESRNYHNFHAASEYEAKHYILPKEFMVVYNAEEKINCLTRKEFFLKLDFGINEIDPLEKQLKNYSKKITYYGLTHKAIMDFEKVKEILIRTSHLFVCQTLLGALRISDFKDTLKTKFREDVTDRKYIRFDQKKTKTKVQNHLLDPVSDICNTYYNGELPPRYTEGDYNKYLKILFKMLDLNRTFIDHQPSLDGGYKDVETPLDEIITNKFARSTFVALMTAQGMPDKEIMKWTGHKSYDIFLTHYQPILEDSRLKSANQAVTKLFSSRFD